MNDNTEALEKLVDIIGADYDGENACDVAETILAAIQADHIGFGIKPTKGVLEEAAEWHDGRAVLCEKEVGKDAKGKQIYSEAAVRHRWFAGSIRALKTKEPTNDT